MQFPKERTFDVIVIGGGAAGLMACGRAAELGKSVLLLEKNGRVGEKLAITGGGRCNVTNAEFNQRELLSQYGKAEQFLYSPFSQFGVKETILFFEDRDVPLVTQAGKRVFPKTEKAKDIVRTMDAYVRQSKVKIATGGAVTKIRKSGKYIYSVYVGSVEYQAQSYILATGGVSHPETGSTGDGFRWLKDMGHTVAKPTPGIVPLQVQDTWIHSLAGTSLPNVRITFFNQEKNLVKKGTILCTHFGISGPLILNAAKAVGDLLYEGPVTAAIDLFPDTEVSILEKNLIALFDENKNKMFKNLIKEMLPPGTTDAILSVLAPVLAEDTQANAITKEMRRKIAETLKALPLTVTGLMGFDRAVVADGGVPLTEIDTKTMKSLLVENLFIIGDLLDINRPSGGYSLQLCWTSGFVAGTNA